MEASKTLLQMKYARIIKRIADVKNKSNSEAMDMFYNSKTFLFISEGVADMHCFSDNYLAEEIIMEHEKNKNYSIESEKPEMVSETFGDDIVCYQMKTEGGHLFLDLKHHSKADFLKITQSKSMPDGSFRREKIYLLKDELVAFRDYLNQIIEHYENSTHYHATKYPPQS